MALNIDRARTAVVTMEMENGVIGPEAPLSGLAEAAAAAELIRSAQRLVVGCRSANIQIVHAIAEWRSDRKGTSLNTPLVQHLSRFPQQILSDTNASKLVDELGPEPDDLISRRLGGLTPFTGTDLDALLRACGIDTVIAVGVSLNVGVLGLVLEGASLGYRMIVPADAVVGVPLDYGHQVIEHSLRPVATITTVDAVVAELANT